ncbi:glucose-1-phosphate adenylyltransferase [Dethiosulfatibacter aminovorans DSM 17477]|uniref:Glucose-1-phosphate adenylyltransferase n=1 Tax=Dethiosulfatibacter aminovorans DSM 17477 TaxID=1121476 RepID=A0A1M6ACY1_9FIRM|nr:glucose-1-phosphate adenylyltransferase subunit GlgD [Dethiosulfatibacter aminovorans]SHI34356.1 glucose-1-phosphate adenylyltransferase [Dethiosulfatibacter aminovorans DSM 17477]
MKNTVGVIINSQNQKDLDKMLLNRSIHTVPIGGKYRLIDFTLSNMINSGISKLGVIGSYKYRSLVDHLGKGENWNLSSKSNDLSILHGGKNVKVGQITRINLQDFLDNIAFFLKIPSTTKYFVISGCNIVSNMDIKKAVHYHIDNDADITMIYKKDYEGEIYNNEISLCTGGGDGKEIKNILHCGEDGGDCKNVFMDMIIINKATFMDILENAQQSGAIDLLDVILKNLNSLKVIGYSYQGYIRIINSINSYFDCSMDLLNADTRKRLFFGDCMIHAKSKDNHPTKYSTQSRVKNSLIASGAKIYGTVENSIVSRGVVVEPGARVKNCIIMQKCIIRRDAVLVDAIIDKYVEITESKILVGTKEKPLVMEKDLVL